ncbi:MAG: hypothetical protein GY810_17945 [Aureispira sp.]|nr:hypothetical protein [Aureispira sp.]
MEEEEKLKYKKTEYPQKHQEQQKKKVAKYSLEDINEEVKTELNEQLEELEMVRKRYQTSYQFRMKSSIFFVVLLIVTIITIIIQGSAFGAFLGWGLGLAIVSLFLVVVWSLTIPAIQKKYQHHFKYTVLERVIDLFFADLRYTPKRMIPEAEFKESKIEETFQSKYKNYKGEDYFEGTYKGYPIQFSEVATTYTKKTVVKKSTKTQITYSKESLFSGVLFVVDISKTPLPRDFWGIAPTQNGERLEDWHKYKADSQKRTLGQETTTKEQFDYQVQKNSTNIPSQLIEKIAELSQKLEEPIWVSSNQGKLYIGVSTILRHMKLINEELAEADILEGIMDVNQLKDDIHYLFSPPKLNVSVLDNKNVILKPLEEIQSCLDIVDNVLTIFEDTRNK